MIISVLVMMDRIGEDNTKTGEITRLDLTMACLVLAITSALAVTAAPLEKREARDWNAMRNRMISEIEADTRASRAYTGIDHLGEDVLAALGRVQRHLFVPEDYQASAYANTPLPIGEGQTISQPFIVGLMTELLDVDRAARILELGTGSGYQAAVLAEIARDVYTVEIVPALADAARRRLNKLGYTNVHVRQGDGTAGWPDFAPFDGIIVTAAGVAIPRPLLEQLAPGARLVMPVGGRDETQQLMVVTRNADGTFAERRTIPVRFVPITGNAGKPASR